MGWWWIAAAAAACAAAYMAVKLLEVLWWRPRRVEAHFARQGIRGPPYRFFIGCVREMVALMVASSAKPMPPPYRSHNVLPRVLAFYHHWKKIYGTYARSDIATLHKYIQVACHAMAPLLTLLRLPAVFFSLFLSSFIYFFYLRNKTKIEVKNRRRASMGEKEQQ